MNDETLRALGKLAPEGMQRDAVHIAVVPVVAGQDLMPGSHVGVTDGVATKRHGSQDVGIVDPYLQEVVGKGQRFWLFLYPGSITSLRHHWAHPAFPIENPTTADMRAEAEAWIRDYLAKSGEDVTYDLFIRVCDTGDQYTVYGHDLHLGISDEAWEKVQVITGRKYDKAHRDDTYFSCSC